MVGAQPAMEIVAKESLVTTMDHVKGKRTEEFVEDPMGVPKQVMERWNPQLVDELPEIFCGEMIFAVLSEHLLSFLLSCLYSACFRVDLPVM